MLRDLNSVGPDLGNENRTGLPLTYCANIEPVLDGQWRIKNILPLTGLATIYGHPGTAKTFLAVEWSLYIALGWDWNGHKVEKGAVIYVGAEGRAGLHNRISAFLKHHDVARDDPAFALIACPIDLLDPNADTPRLISAIREAASHLSEKPALVVLDTLSKTFGGGDENGKDMAQYVANCERIASEFNCCILPVHHRPKESANSQPRGHGSLRGGLDSIFLVEGSSGIRSMTISKQKDGEEGSKVCFKLKPIELGTDSEGDPVTSCVIEIVEDFIANSNPLAAKIRKLSDNQRIVWDQIPLEIAKSGLPVPDEIPDDVINRKTVSIVMASDTFSDRCIAVLRTGSDNKPDSARTAYNRSIKSLQRKELIGVYEEWMWSNVA